MMQATSREAIAWRAPPCLDRMSGDDQRLRDRILVEDVHGPILQYAVPAALLRSRR